MMADSAELQLLHKQVNPSYVRRIDFVAGNPHWQTVDPSPEIKKHTKVFYHLWDIDCKPCLDELPAVKSIMKKIKEKGIYPVYIAETVEANRLQYYYLHNIEKFDLEAAHFHINSPDLRRNLGLDTQPISLLTDGRGVIHRAFVGSLKGREDDFWDKVKLFREAMEGFGSSGLRSLAKPCPLPEPIKPPPPETPLEKKDSVPDKEAVLQSISETKEEMKRIREDLNKFLKSAGDPENPRNPSSSIYVNATQLKINADALIKSHEETRKDAWWFRLGALGGVLAAVVSVFNLWLGLLGLRSANKPGSLQR